MYIFTVCRVEKLAGSSGSLSKHDFVRLLRSSDLFMKTFDKNKDGIVTEVSYVYVLQIFFEV